MPHLFTYTPSLHEIVITAGAMGICVAGFFMGERLFRGHLSEDH
jgi:molybdopterin-containing oxidoreductase family membrane subunit